MTAFSAQKILLFTPQFFGYGQEIAKKLQSLGAVVDIYDERPGNDFWTKAIIRVNKSFLMHKINGYYQNIISNLQQEYYDHVLFLNAEAISPKHLSVLRDNQSRATFTLYMWDSLKNKKYTLDLLPYFDRKFSFDKEDCLDKDNAFHFRPLFFLDAYKNIQSIPEPLSADLLFVGTAHSDRYQLLMNLKQKCTELGKSTDLFMFFQNKKLYYAQKASNRAFRTAKMSDFEFKALPKDVLIEKIKRSRVVLDIQHPGQKGLTMRTIEMIGARKKLITTNREVMQYDFYHPNNMFYLDRDTLLLDPSWFESPYLDLAPRIFHKYSLDGWLEEVFWAPIKH